MRRSIWRRDPAGVRSGQFGSAEFQIRRSEVRPQKPQAILFFCEKIFRLQAAPASHPTEMLGTIEEIQERLPSFDPRNFLKSSKSAFEMIITSGSNTSENLELLVDKRYIDHFKSIIASYGDMEKSSGLEAKSTQNKLFH